MQSWHPEPLSLFDDDLSVAADASVAVAPTHWADTVGVFDL